MSVFRMTLLNFAYMYTAENSDKPYTSTYHCEITALYKLNAFITFILLVISLETIGKPHALINRLTLSHSTML